MLLALDDVKVALTRGAVFAAAAAALAALTLARLTLAAESTLAKEAACAALTELLYALADDSDEECSKSAIKRKVRDDAKAEDRPAALVER